jgi:CheY-like chemotaxis protein/CheY-specific phosphatase CheX/anti-sigma regulatory factor (Ser/Thr protein kinase)
MAETTFPDIETLTKLLENAVLKVMQTTAHMGAKYLKRHSREESDGTPFYKAGSRDPLIVGSVGFTGEANGMVYLYMEIDLAAQIAAGITGMTTAELLTTDNADIIKDVVGEITNMTVGTFKNGICDPLRLRQIINNLLSNAVKFTDEGSITMTARYEERRLVVAIADTGKGMEPADRERIFQEFTRLPGAQGKEGFGLGLSIVRMLVQLLEGTIDVDSVPGKGSTFTLRVPLFPVQVSEDTGEKYQETETGTSSALSESMPASSQPSLRVLLIDDDRIQLTLTAAMLQHSGIASVSCMQLDELLDALRSDTFDVLLTDVQMPAINGFDLLKLLRASNLPQAQAIPVIAVTARSDMKPEEFKEYGFAGCLHKPFTVAELFRELNAEGIGQTSAVQSEVAAAETVEASSPDAPYDFSALTAFSGDDPEAAKSIMESFVTETRLNAERLQKAADAADMDEVAAVSHKMIPLFTLIGATELVAELKILEGLRGTPFTAGQRQRALRSLALIEDIIRLQARAD